MEAFEIVRLLGACIALILGSIVFMVLFFRGMSWIDRWIKKRSETDLSRLDRKRDKNANRPNSLNGDSRIRRRPPTAERPPKEFPSLKPIPKNWDQISMQKAEDLLVNGRACMQGFVTGASADGSAITSASTDLLTKVAELSAEKECIAKSVSRIATVHLLSGETIERVTFCSKDKAHKICDGLGFEGVVFENDEGQISVVREDNIKMVTWKVG